MVSDVAVAQLEWAGGSLQKLCGRRNRVPDRVATRRGRTAVMRVRGILWSTILAAIFLAVSSGTLGAFCQTSAPAWPSAVEHAALEAPEARIVVIDIASGHLLAAHRLNDASRTLAAPGSTDAKDGGCLSDRLSMQHAAGGA